MRKHDGKVIPFINNNNCFEPTYSDQHKDHPFSPKQESNEIFIYESELQFMAQETVSAEYLETGGTLFGYRNEYGKPCIQIAGPAGSNCLKRNTYFSQDVHYFNHCQQLLIESHGITALGNFHSHHYLGLDCPSDVDAAHSQNIVNNNNISNWIQIITVRLDHPQKQCRERFQQKRNGNSSKNLEWNEQITQPQVKISAYIYGPNSNRKPKEVFFRTLPGVSPLRLSVARAKLLDEVEEDLIFPMSSIKLNTDESDFSDQQIPSNLLEQCNQLPIDIKENLSYFRDNTSIVLILSLTGEEKLCLAYSEKALLELQHVFWLPGKAHPHRNITELIGVLQTKLSVLMIYRKSVSTINQIKKKKWTNIRNQRGERTNVDQ